MFSQIRGKILKCTSAIFTNRLRRGQRESIPTIESRNSTLRNHIALLLPDLNVDDIIIQYYFFSDGVEANRYVRILTKEGGHVTASVHRQYDQAASDSIKASDIEDLSALTNELRQLRIAIENLQQALVVSRKDSPVSGRRLQ